MARRPSLLLIGVATRKIGRAVRLPEGRLRQVDGDGTSKSAASRRFVALSQERMEAWLKSDLSKLDLLVIQIDGLHVAEDIVLIGAIGIDGHGMKHVLGLVEGGRSVGTRQSRKDPQRTLPKAIFLTLAISTLLYILIVWIALVSVPRDELAAARAPLSLVFQRVTGASPFAISAIAIVATVNGIIALMVMASRVIYGMADRQMLPSGLAHVSPRTRTPTNATALVVVGVLVLALAFPLEELAETTSRLTLVIFAFVNAALVLLKRKGDPLTAGTFSVPIAVPIAGCVLCVALLFGGLLS